MPIALALVHIMETIRPTSLTRIDIPGVPPEAAPESPLAGFTQVLACQKGPGLANESPVGIDGQGSGSKDAPASDEEANLESSGPPATPEWAALLAMLLPDVALPSPPLQTGEPSQEIDGESFSQKASAQQPLPVFCPKEIAGGAFPQRANVQLPFPAFSRVGEGPFDFSLQLGKQVPTMRNTDPGAEPSEVDRPERPGEAREPGPSLGLLLQSREGIGTTGNKPDPAFSRAFIPLEGAPPEDPTTLKRPEKLILPPVPDALGVQEKEASKTMTGSLQVETEGGPSFSSPSPTSRGMTPVVEGVDLSSAVIVPQQPAKGQNTPQAVAELLPGSQSPPAEALPQVEKASPAPVPERPPISEKGQAEPNLKGVPVFVTAVYAGTAKAIPASAGTASQPGLEDLPHPERASPALTRPDTGIVFSAAGLIGKSGLGERPAGTRGKPGRLR